MTEIIALESTSPGTAPTGRPGAANDALVDTSTNAVTLPVGNTTTGSALAITGTFESADALSMWITCPGSGGTSPMRRAITSMRSGSRNEACVSRNARFISVKLLSSRFADSIW